MKQSTVSGLRLGLPGLRARHLYIVTMYPSVQHISLMIVSQIAIISEAENV
jgi:hypothetical protein